MEANRQPGQVLHKQPWQGQELPNATGEAPNPIPQSKGLFACRYKGRMPPHIPSPSACGSSLAVLHICYEDGTEKIIHTDETWQYSQCQIRFSEIYDGEYYDATYVPDCFYSAIPWAYGYDMLIPQEGELVLEQERVYGLL